VIVVAKLHRKFNALRVNNDVEAVETLHRGTRLEQSRYGEDDVFVDNTFDGVGKVILYLTALYRIRFVPNVDFINGAEVSTEMLWELMVLAPPFDV